MAVSADSDGLLQVWLLLLAGFAAIVVYVWPLIQWQTAHHKRNDEEGDTQEEQLRSQSAGSCATPASEEGVIDVADGQDAEVPDSAESPCSAGSDAHLPLLGDDWEMPGEGSHVTQGEAADKELANDDDRWHPEEDVLIPMMQATSSSSRRSLSQALDAAAADRLEDPGEVIDGLITHLEESLLQVDLSQQHAVLLRRAELHVLTLLGAGRDFLLRSLHGRSDRRQLEALFGGDCARISQLRAVLESLQLSAGRVGDARLKGCRDACDAVESVLHDLGLKETLRKAQQLKKAALLATLEQKRFEEQILLKKRREQAQQLKRLQEEQRKALETALESQQEVDGLPEAEAQGKSLDLKPDFATRDASMLNWFLDYAEGLLCDVLCFLDGHSLARLESAGRWPQRLCATSLQGVWRFIHLCHLGGKPPRTLARAPQPRTRGRSGAWKQYWLGRQLLLRESDGTQRQIAFEQARLLLPANAHAVVQPMKPSARLLRRVIGNCLPAGFTQDSRFGPLQERWLTHLMVGAESMVTHANGVQTNYEQFFMSWSVCFSAAQGLPRLFLASARFSEQDAWEVDLADCRLPPRAPLAWAAAAQEIHELRAAGRDVSAGLCDARELCSARFQGPTWRVQSAQLAPAAEWALLHKDLFSCSVDSASGRQGCLRLLLALCCPNPFAQEAAKLELALTALEPHLEPVE